MEYISEILTTFVTVFIIVFLFRLLIVDKSDDGKNHTIKKGKHIDGLRKEYLIVTIILNIINVFTFVFLAVGLIIFSNVYNTDLIISIGMICYLLAFISVLNYLIIRVWKGKKGIIEYSNFCNITYGFDASKITKKIIKLLMFIGSLLIIIALVN